MDGSEGFIIGDGKNNRPDKNNTQETSSLLNAAKVWPNVKPFVNGFLTGQILWLQSSCPSMLAKRIFVHNHGFEKDLLVVKQLSPDLHDHLKARLKHLEGSLSSQSKGIPFNFFYLAAYSTAQFGTFDFLKEWIKDRNGGIPLALHQEACCGMISGGIAGCISYPLFLAHPSVNPNSNLRTLLHPLYLQARKEGFFPLWKGSGHHIRTLAFLNMGLLTSYNRSLSYIRDSAGLSNTASQIGAGMVSAFCAAACGSTYDYISKIDEVTHRSYGDFNYSTRLRLVVKTLGSGLRPGGEVRFYTGVLRNAIGLAPIAVVSWLSLESIKKFEESRGY